MANNLKRILIAGEGGQGVQAIASIIAKVAHGLNKKVVHLPNFGVEQRGGVSLAFIQISDEEIAFPKFQDADIAVILAGRAIPRIEEYLNAKPLIMFDNSIVSETKLEGYKVEKIAIPATIMAKDRLIPRVFNMIILGALAEELGLKSKEVKKETLELFKAKIAKKGELKHFNIAALELGEKTIKRLKEKG
jgi:2-oxoglutarate ferredoxin oxidoreductase subunit gamma